MKRILFVLAVAALLIVPTAALVRASGAVVTDNAPIGAQIGGAVVTIVDFAFTPGWVAVPAGSTVSWYNAGAAPHTVTSDAGIFASGTIGSGGSYAVTFTTPGYYSYYCSIHPGMTGAVQVN